MNYSLLKKGTYLALLVALISGVSIFVNSFGVRQVSDPFVFTTAKNLLVALTLGALILLPTCWSEIKSLSGRQLSTLVLLGLIGGSIPFLLFFYGLQSATAPSAAFVHKTLFIWVAIMAAPFLKERLGRLQLVALAILIIGQLVLVGRPAQWAFGRAELFVLMATLLWAAEAVIAKRLMYDVSTRVAALGRMGVGALIMLAFLLATGRAEALAQMSGTQWMWVAITSIFLLAYVGGYYGALKRAPATMVTSLLVLGSVLTSLLHALFNARTYSVEQVAGFSLIAVSVGLWVYVGRRYASHSNGQVATANLEAGNARR